MLELRRGIVFGQYIDRPSPIHRLDPRIKLLATAAFVVATFAVNTLAGFLLLLPFAVGVQWGSRIPISYLARGSRLFVGFLVFVLAVEVLFYPSPHEILWRWTVLSVSVSALTAAGLLALRVLYLYWITTMLMFVTPVVDLTDALEALLRPLQRLHVPVHELTLVALIAVKFVPIFTDEAERLATARAARGEPFDTGGPLLRARRLGRLLVPIFISGFRRADELTVALDARCYRGGRQRTKLRVLHAPLSAWLALLGAVLWMVLAWWLPSVV